MIYYSLATCVFRSLSRSHIASEMLTYCHSPAHSCSRLGPRMESALTIGGFSALHRALHRCKEFLQAVKRKQPTVGVLRAASEDIRMKRVGARRLTLNDKERTRLCYRRVLSLNSSMMSDVFSVLMSGKCSASISLSASSARLRICILPVASPLWKGV